MDWLWDWLKAFVVSRSLAGEPQARYHHAAVGVGQTLCVWGGDGSGTLVQVSTVECFDVPSATWQEPRQLRVHTLREHLLPTLRSMAVTADGERAYWFGGWNGWTNTDVLLGPPGHRYDHDTLTSLWIASRYSNAVYEVNMMSLECRELAPATASPAPSEKYGSGMVHYQNMLVVYGGLTSEGRPTDELHVFDLNTNLWSAQATTGDRPPALSDLTLTKIDQHRAALFGGYDGRGYHNDTYVLDMATWHWSKVKTSGGRPPARDDHAAFCIAGPLTGQPHPLLIVTGGWGEGSGELSDVWILDVAQGLWSQVALPTAITERWGHSAVIFGCGPDFRVVVLFGGRKTIHVGSEISETTFLLMSVRRGCWEVERVVGPGGLAAPDHRLREQMRRLQLSPQPQFERQTGELTQQLQLFCAEFERQTGELTQQLQQATQRAALPESIQEMAAAVSGEGGVQALEEKINNMPKLVQPNCEVLTETLRMLDEEEREDSELRSRFKEKWTRQPSGALVENQNLRKEVNKYRTILEVASGADQEVQEKFQSHREAIVLLGKPIAELQAALSKAGTLSPHMQSSQNVGERERKLKELATGYDAFQKLCDNITEGTKFYNDLTPLLLRLQSKISDFTFARRTEKDDMLKDLQKSITNQPAMAPPINSQYQKQTQQTPPRPAPSQATASHPPPTQMSPTQPSTPPPAEGQYQQMPLAQVPTLEDLMTKVAAAIPHKWRDVAVGLGLKAADIQRIDAENPQQNCNRCYIAVFDTWERTETKPYIWKTIIDCLHSSLIKESKLAKEISAHL